ISSPFLILAVEARREATGLVVDMTAERCAEVTGHQPSTRAGAVLQRRPPALARPDRLGAREAVPLRRIDLQRVMQDVAAEQPLLAARFELDGNGAGRVARSGLDLEMLVELGGAVDHLRQPR